MSKESDKVARQAREAAEAEKRRAQRRTSIAFAVGMVAILGLLSAIVVVAIVSSHKDKVTDPTKGALVTPSSALPTGGLPVGKADAPVTLDLYFDFMCPACKRFEEANAQTIDNFIKDGTVRLVLHPMTFLDSQSRGTHYSTRAASALGEVGDKAPDKVWHFNAGLFAHQPAEGSDGLTDDFIKDVATSAGVPKAVSDTFTQLRFAPWAKKSNDEATKEGVSSTPWVLLNGKHAEGDLLAEGALAKAVQDAAAMKTSTK